jgi:predicted transcriptional regulator of viral defense system
MTFRTFRTSFQHYPFFSIKEIEKLYPRFDYKNLGYWQEKKYVQKIRNGHYILTEKGLDTDTLYFISNQMYAPSYISLETALSHYGFIPEGVFKITAISTLKTQSFTTPMGVFSYQNLKPSLYFGYNLIPFGDFNFKIADAEKTILDYLYLHPELNSEDHFFEMRFNALETMRQLNLETLQNYQLQINSQALNKRVKTLLKFLNHA